jgi:quinol monooxygenase YgiN
MNDLNRRKSGVFIAIVDLRVAPTRGLEALGALLAEAPAIRAMAGNLAFQPYLHPERNGEIRIFQEWRDAASYEAYAASPVLLSLRRTLRPLMAAAPSRRMIAEDPATVH